MNLRIFTWRMSLTKSLVFVVVLTFLSTFNGGDAEVCIIMDSCILPCRYVPGNDAVIHWNRITNEIPVHSYYHNRDQLAHQNPRYKDRTSLFKDKISSGNASLLLEKVEVQDEGGYQCYTSTITGNKVSTVHIDVEAPVRKVNIQKAENIITCSSEGIYPKPKLTWSTNPPSNVTGQEEVKTEQQIYNIKSSLTVSDDVALVYTCTISNGRRGRTASWHKPTSVDVLNTETTIHCTATNPPRTRLVWTFNQTQIILNQTGDSPYTASEKWTKLVKTVSESGNLILQGLSSDHEGMYTCEQSNDEETLITNTMLRLAAADSPVVAIAVGCTIGVIVAIILVVLFIFWKKKEKKEMKNQTVVLEPLT